MAALPVFSSDRRDPRAPLLPTVHRRVVAETCQVYGEQDIRGCRRPRPASACLQRQHCIFTRAHCEDVSTSLNATVFSLPSLVDVESSTAFYYEFVSDSTAICASSDTSCASCWPDLNRRSHNSSVQCIGVRGCLCEDLVQFLDHNSTLSTYNQCGIGFVDSQRMGDWLPWFVSFLCVSVFVISACASSQRKAARIAARTIRRQATRVLRHMLDLVPGDFQLDLFGWRQHRRDLHHKEQLLLEGFENLSPVAAPMEYAAFPSAPEFDLEEEASAPTKQDPMALASAPVFSLLPQADESTDHERGDRKPMATAPDYEDDTSLIK